ncbi:hypothetical protein MCOR25_002074 [Pyricularia grisea]|uniref:Polyprenal reductase n=1 Tax=Pyricularia grisea TaxID=148305 RepID=A0A6P8BA90_PYRGI|nr:uncharacterized protein PgNI_03153 [Pyricularia grisea]KAI6379090.1 hypothetical protein MCOR25_002074 [Pyricularia grisea]TLD12602.1 hypothetical protein PgNI_03153 [Pyricularia grisea]
MRVYEYGITVFQLLSPAQWVQTFFILAAAAVLALTVLPSRTRRLLLDYGARGGSRPSAAAAGDWLEAITATVTSWGQIPHSWFAAFYATSLAGSAFWAYQFVFQSELLRVIASAQDAGRSETADQSLVAVKVAWALMALQGARRLFEQLFVVQSSTSKMWIVHWALGLSFYMFMSVAVWIQGSGSILDQWSNPNNVHGAGLNVFTGSVMFLIASVTQFKCHSHLANLKKYSLPTHGLFQYTVCAHYTCECLIYFSLAIVAAPEGQLFNKTILAAVVFVAVNLGLTAYGTRKWYETKFGADKIASRWTMIPLVY